MAETASVRSPSDPGHDTAASGLATQANPSKTKQALTPSDSNGFEESARPGKRPRLNPPLMTAASAAVDASQKLKPLIPPSTQTSPNPSSQVLNTLMGSPENAISKATIPITASVPADPATTMSAPMAMVVDTIQQPAGEESSVTTDGPMQTSPASVSSINTLESMADPSALTTTVGSPLPMLESGRDASSATDALSTSPDGSNKAFSYPAPLLPPQLSEGHRRGMSLPHSGTRQGTRSPSNKKHRCPYCATEFTRHHNLKSHLLTHSQEKPYVCSTCQSRFRRLHDLKRHTKLHTGERPHICPKCGRKFARGDALARHNKGPGGCAGRRASVGSFGGEDDFDGDDSMEGVMYNEPDAMDDEEGNDTRPAIRRQAPSGDDTGEERDHSSRIPNTYPPIQGRPPGGIASGNFLSRTGFGNAASGSSSNAVAQGTPLPYPHPSSTTSSGRPAGPGSGVFAQNPLTESPKPLSPGQSQSRGPGPAEGSLNRNRSSSTTHFQSAQQGYGRGSGPGLNIPPPSAPQLPPPHGLNPPDQRFTLASQGGPAHPPTQPSGPPTHMSGSGQLSSHSNSLSSHGHSGHGSGETSSPMFTKDDRIWAYVKSLEQRMNSMQDEINGLRTQLANATQAQQPRMA